MNIVKSLNTDNKNYLYKKATKKFIKNLDDIKLKVERTSRLLREGLFNMK